MRPARHVLSRILLLVLVVVLVALVGGYLYAKPLLFTGSGYAAHNACAVTFVAGRSDPAGDLPPNPLVAYLRTDVQPGQNRADSSVLGGLARQRAWHVPGYGCVVAEQAPVFAKTRPAVDPAANPFAEAPAPSPSAEVAAAVATAFGDDLPAEEKQQLGTRAVLVAQGGRLVAERYAPGFNAGTRQLGWSMAKSVTNLLVGRLVNQGKISVTDDRLRPEWSDDRAKITVDDLMRMTSGLEWDETYDLGTPITSMLYLEPDMAGFAASLPLAHPPGTHQQYSSGSTNLLCDVLQDRADAGPELPYEPLLAPLGLSSAIWEPDATGLPVCSSYLWATPRDWAAIGQFALQDGAWQGEQLLPAGWMAESTTARSNDTDVPGYGAGWYANRLPDGSLADPDLPADTYHASGHDGQMIYVVPSADLVVVRLGFTPNAPDGGNRVAGLVRDLVTLDR